MHIKLPCCTILIYFVQYCGVLLVIHDFTCFCQSSTRNPADLKTQAPFWENGHLILMSQHSILQISSGIPSGLTMWRRATIVHQIISAAMMVTVCRCGAAVTQSHSAVMAPMRLGVTNQKQVRHPMVTSSGLQLNLNAASLVERTVSCKSIALLQDTCCMQLCGIVGCHSVSSLINVYCWWNCPLYNHHFVCWVLHPWWNCPCSTVSFFDEWCILDETVICQIITLVWW